MKRERSTSIRSILNLQGVGFQRLLKVESHQKISRKSQLGRGFETLEDRIVLSAYPLLDSDLFIPSGASDTTEVQAQAINDQSATDGNTYRTASNIGVLAGSTNIHDYVGRGDRKDIYQFQINSQTNVVIKLQNLEADAELRLLDGNRDLIKWSLRSDTNSEIINTTLESGRYFVRVDALDGLNSSEYDLNFVATDTRADGGGNSLGEATDLGILDQENEIRISGWVGNSDRWDYYQFQADQFLSIRAVLSQLSANADLYFYNSKHSLLDSSTNRGKTIDRVNGDISPGIYIFGVKARHGDLTYDLSVAAEPDDSDGRLENVDFYGTTARDSALNAIYAPEAWNAGYSGKGVVIAVIDSGVDNTHSDLKNQIWTNSGEIAGDGIDNDNNGFIDDVRGWDFSEDDNSPSDLNGHGTHVAGIIASAQNKFGATGIAYDAQIMSIRVLDQNGDGSFGQLARGIYYAVDNGADVINLSIGGEYSYAVRAAIAYANSNGVFVAVASGNGGLEMPAYPARHSASLSNVISVGAHNAQDTHAWFSNYVGQSGVQQVDAPGVNIYSTLPDSRYGRYSGTSSAAPFVTGLAALVLSVDPDFSPSLVRHFIAEGAIRNISGSDSIGGIDAARTLYLARNYGGNSGGSEFEPGNDGTGTGTDAGGPGIQKQNVIDWHRIAQMETPVELSVMSDASALRVSTYLLIPQSLASLDLSSTVLPNTVLPNTTPSNTIEIAFANYSNSEPFVLTSLSEQRENGVADSLVAEEASDRHDDSLKWLNSHSLKTMG